MGGGEDSEAGGVLVVLWGSFSVSPEKGETRGENRAEPCGRNYLCLLYCDD